MAEFILAHVLHDGSTRPCCELGSFGHNDDGEVASALVTLADGFGNLVDIERPFRNQYGVSTARNTAVEGDPSRIAPHYFDDHDPVVRFRRRVNAVNRLAHDVTGSVEAEGVVRPAQIVIDR